MKTAPLGEIAEIVSGATPKTGVNEYWGGDVQWATPADLSKLDGPYIAATPRTLTDAGVNSCATTVLPAGSVLLSSRAPIGHVAINTVPMATNQGFKSLVPGPELDAKYLYHWLKSKTVHLQSLGNGATFKELSKKTTEQIQVPLPSLPEQRRIAAILDHGDALHAKRRQVLAHLDALAQALYEHMIGSNDWPYVKIKTITSKVGSGATPRGGQSAYKTEGVALIRSMNVHDGKFIWKDLAFLDDQQAAALSNVVVEADDVLLNITGASVARVNRAPASVLPARVNQHVAIIRPRPGTVHPRILERHLISPRAKRALLNVAGGGATREAITKAQILDLEVPIPDRSAQERYLSAAARLDDLQGRSRAALEAADSLVMSLQSRAFRGEL